MSSIIFDWHTASISHCSVVADSLDEFYYCKKSTNSKEDLVEWITTSGAMSWVYTTNVLCKQRCYRLDNCTLQVPFSFCTRQQAIHGTVLFTPDLLTQHKSSQAFPRLYQYSETFLRTFSTSVHTHSLPRPRDAASIDENWTLIERRVRHLERTVPVRYLLSYHTVLPAPGDQSPTGPSHVAAHPIKHPNANFTTHQVGWRAPSSGRADDDWIPAGAGFNRLTLFRWYITMHVLNNWSF